MSDLRDAARQALEALDLCRDWPGAYDECSQAVTTLRAALEQPEQEPVAWLYPEGLEALQKGKCWTVYGTKQDAQCSIPVYLNGAVAPKVEPAQAECAGFDSQPAPHQKLPEQEPVPKSTWQKLYEAAIDQRNEAVAELRRLHAENVLLHERHHFDNGVLEELLQALKDATDAIEHWGSYSSDYFQQKWDLQSDINAARAAIARAEGKVLLSAQGATHETF